MDADVSGGKGTNGQRHLWTKWGTTCYVPFNFYAFNCYISEISTIGDDGWDSVDILLKFFGC